MVRESCKEEGKEFRWGQAEIIQGYNIKWVRSKAQTPTMPTVFDRVFAIKNLIQANSHQLLDLESNTISHHPRIKLPALNTPKKSKEKYYRQTK